MISSSVNKRRKFGVVSRFTLENEVKKRQKMRHQTNETERKNIVFLDWFWWKIFVLLWVECLIKHSALIYTRTRLYQDKKIKATKRLVRFCLKHKPIARKIREKLNIHSWQKDVLRKEFHENEITSSAKSPEKQRVFLLKLFKRSRTA